MISTAALPTPPEGYGGTETMVAELARGLVDLGHQVVVYATGDSSCAGDVMARFPVGTWPPSDAAEQEHAAFAFGDLSRRQVDVVHVHSAGALRAHRGCSAPCFLTMHHDRQAELVSLYRSFPEVRLVAVSERQRALHPELAFAGVVHHGIDPGAFDFGGGVTGYAAFVGRFCEDKGVHLAIDAALAADVPLILGGAPRPAFDDAERYFLTEVQPRIRANADRIMWLGELRHRAKVALLRDARALLFPIQWEEPFGLVMIESMLVGTPVIAFDRGSAREVIEEGVTGFIVGSEREMGARLRQLKGFDRARCRERAAERWSTARMTAEYVALYESALRARGDRPPRSAGGVRDAA